MEKINHPVSSKTGWLRTGFLRGITRYKQSTMVMLIGSFKSLLGGESHLESGSRNTPEKSIWNIPSYMAFLNHFQCLKCTSK